MAESGNHYQPAPAETLVFDLSVATLPTSPPPNSVASKFNLLEAQWSDISEDDGGNPSGLFGIAFEEFSSKQLRVICSKLNIKGVRNAKKPEMIERIMKSYNNKKAYSAMMAHMDSKLPAEEKGMSSSRKQIQCPFRLLNIIFSDDFVEEFATLGNVSSRQLLDSGKASNQQHFWERVSDAFQTSDDRFGILYFLDDGIMADHSHIDPSRMVPHDWKKLRAMWKAINADYKSALVRFTQSGTHDHNFYTFCNGKVEIYYLRKYLEVRPNINATVEAGLPEECAISSDGTISLSSNNSENKKKKRGSSDLLDAIRECNFGVNPEVAKQKLVYMEKEDARRQQAEMRLQADHLQKKQKNLLEEWEKMQNNIRILRQDLRDDLLDSVTKREIEDDIAALVKRKNQLATELGLK